MLLMRSSLHGLDAFAKYFLIRAVWLFGDGVISDQPASLAMKFGMPAQKLANAMAMLVVPHQSPRGPVQYFESVPAERGAQTKRGRPRRAIRLAKGFQRELWDQVQWLEKSGVSMRFSWLSEAVVCTLICGPSGWSVATRGPAGEKGKPPVRSGDARELSRINRLLLASLWSVANEGGVVAGYGVAQISELAGLSRAQVDRQLEKLEELGFVRRRYGGVSSSGIFGRATGFIYLDPVHEKISIQDPYGRRISWRQMPAREGLLDGLSAVFRGAAQLTRRSRQLTKQIKEGRYGPEALQAKRRALDTDIDFFYRGLGMSCLMKGFESGGEPGFYEVLGTVRADVKAHALAVVCKYAGDILYDQGRRLLELNTEVDGGIAESVREYVVAAGRKPKSGQYSLRDEEAAMWFYRMSCDLATMICRFLESTPEVGRKSDWTCGAIVPEFQFGEVVSLSLLVIETKF